MINIGTFSTKRITKSNFKKFERLTRLNIAKVNNVTISQHYYFYFIGYLLLVISIHWNQNVPCTLFENIMSLKDENILKPLFSPGSLALVQQSIQSPIHNIGIN